MRPHIARAGKQRLSRRQILRVRAGVHLRVQVLPFVAGCAVGKARAGAQNELPAVRLEPVHAQLIEIGALAEPALNRLRVGEIRHQGTGEPVPLRDFIGSPALCCHAQAALCGVGPVQLQLTVCRFVRLQLLIDRYLPQHEVHAFAVQILYHLPRLRPGGGGKVEVIQAQCCARGPGLILRAAEDIKCSLVAPGLHYRHGDGEAPLLRLGHGVLQLFAAVPVVG